MQLSAEGFSAYLTARNPARLGTNIHSPRLQIASHHDGLVSLRRFHPLGWHTPRVIHEDVEARIGLQKRICELFHLLAGSGGTGEEQTSHAR